MSDHTIVVIWVIHTFFIQFFCIFLPLLNLFFCVKSFCFLPFIAPIFAINSLLVSLIFLKWSLVFPILLFSSISLLWSLKKTFLSLLAILWNSALFPFFLCLSLLFFPQLFVRPSQKTILSSCISFLGDGFSHWIIYNVTNLHT